MTTKPGVYSKAFNLGSQARINGVPLSENPYRGTELAAGWEHGWIDVERNWGSMRTDRYPPLPNPRQGDSSAKDRNTAVVLGGV